MSLMKAKGLALYCKLDGTNFSTIGNVSNLKLPAAEQQFEDVTVLMSTCVEDGEPIGLAAPGECTGDLFYDPNDTGHAEFYIACGIEDVVPCLCEIRKGATVLWRFTATPRKMEPTAAVKSFMKANFNLKLQSIAALKP